MAINPERAKELVLQFGPLETAKGDERTKFRTADDICKLYDKCKEIEEAEILAENPCACIHSCDIVGSDYC